MKEKKTGAGLSSENFNLIKQGTPVIYKIIYDFVTIGRKKIKKRAHENPHRRIRTLDIGRLVSYAAATVGDLQSKGSETQTKKWRDKHRGSDLLKHNIVTALHSHNGGS